MKITAILPRRKRLEDSPAYGDALARARLAGLSAQGPARAEVPAELREWAVAPLAGGGADSENPYTTGPLPAQAVETAVADGEAGRAIYRPSPSFTPNVAETAAQPVLPANARVPASVRTGRADALELAMLGRVRAGLVKKYRAEAFAADKQMPCFDAVTRTAGWLGLHMPRRRIAGHQRWTTEPWLSQALTTIETETESAMALNHAHDAAWDVVERQARARARRRAAADAAPLLAERLGAPEAGAQ